MEQALARSRLEELYRAHADQVHAYLCYRVGRDNAADLTSETFLTAWRRIDDVPAETPLAWLLGVARRTSANSLRGARRRQQFLVTAAAIAEITLPDTAEYSARRLDLISALRQLKPADQEVLVLIAWYELTNGEAAEVLGCSKGAFAVRLHTARKRLSRVLGPSTAVYQPHSLLQETP